MVVHELGHAMGMGHPSDSCTEETMYRFATEGETKKRDLFTGDIAKINDLY
ncbi:MAG: matrixin family metalloprotease [Gemmatimonadota bacterium]